MKLPSLDTKRTVSIVALLLLGVGVTYAFLHTQQYAQPTSLVSQQEEQLEPDELASIVKGYVYVDYVNTNHATEGDNGLRMSLKLHNLSNETTQTLMHFSNSNLDPVQYPASHFALRQGIIYFVDNNGALSHIKSPFTRSEELSVGLKEGEHISSYLFDNQNLYYLAGPFCDMHGGECDSTLRVTDMTSGKTRDIAYHLTYSTIDGFDTSRTYAYVSNFFGDAGCFSVKIIRLDLRTGQQVKLPEYGGCSWEDEAASDAQTAAHKAFLDTLVPKLTSVNHLTWENGSLRKPSTTIDLPEVWNYISLY